MKLKNLLFIISVFLLSNCSEEAQEPNQYETLTGRWKVHSSNLYENSSCEGNYENKVYPTYFHNDDETDSLNLGFYWINFYEDSTFSDNPPYTAITYDSLCSRFGWELAYPGLIPTCIVDDYGNGISACQLCEGFEVETEYTELDYNQYQINGADTECDALYRICKIKKTNYYDYNIEGNNMELEIKPYYNYDSTFVMNYGLDSSISYIWSISNDTLTLKSQLNGQCLVKKATLHSSSPNRP
tara:strand:+ start:305 stop:1030 length:726 start_codon:yes stop_codon:yes gene_type:complete